MREKGINDERNKRIIYYLQGRNKRETIEKGEGETRGRNEREILEKKISNACLTRIAL